MYRQPPPLNYSAGSVVIAVLMSATEPGVFEVYGVNTTGFEPASSVTPSGRSRQESLHSQQEYGKATLMRFTTTDFKSYSTPHAALHVDWAGTPTMKSIARSDDGRYVLFCYLSANPVEPDPTQRAGAATFVSTDAGMSWTRANTTGIADPDKDDLNIIFNRGRFVDMQIVWQPWKLRYCDNGGCFRRRTVSAKTSVDGVSWDADRPLITPDDKVVGCCSRLSLCACLSCHV